MHISMSGWCSPDIREVRNGNCYLYFTVCTWEYILLQANESYGQKEKLTLNFENVSVETLLNKIESLTDYKFLYN